MGDESTEEFLINILIDPIDAQEKLNYIKTLWLLNKEPELEGVVKILEHLVQASKIKKAEEYAEYQKEQKRIQGQQERYAYDQQQQQIAHSHQINPWDVKYTGGTTGRTSTTATAIQQKTEAEYQKIAAHWSKVKGEFDPPF